MLMRIMRNLCGVPPRLSSAIKLNLVSCTKLATNYGSYRYTTHSADSQEKLPEEHFRGLSEEVSKAIEAIRRSKTWKASVGKTMYLVDKDAAKEFSAVIVADRKSKSSHVVEINSGLGFLSRELLDAGIPSINMFESVPYLLPNLSSIVDEYPGRAILRPIDFHNIWNIGYVDWKENSNKLQSYLEDIKKTPWDEKPAVEIIGAFADINYIRRVISTVVFQNSIAKFGRMVLHVAVPPSVWAHLTCTNEHYDLYRWYIIIFQTLFDYELRGSLPRSAFYPHYRYSNMRSRRECRRKIMRNDGREMSIVKIEPKADLFTGDFTVSDVIPFYYFVHQHLKCRKNRVIPALEKWVPGCGRILIGHGFNIFTEFGELTPQEIMRLFKLFRSWPEFKKSSFVSSMDMFLMKIDEHGHIDTNAENLEEMFQFTLEDVQSLD